MAKKIAAVVIFLLCGSLLIVHNYPIASDPYRGVPEASQLLYGNPDAKTIEIDSGTLEDVLNDFGRQRDFYHNAVKKAAVFNVIAIVLCIVIYRLLPKKRIEEHE